MTEIPEHLLARSKARRSAMGGGGDAPATAAADTPAASAAPATQAAASAAPAVVDTTPKEPDPVAPWVEAANSRRKIPFWALPVLIGLIPWAAMYMLTLDPPTPKELGPLDAGAEVYGTKGCSGCHGATGQGSGANPALTGDTGVAEVFTNPGSQVAWVAVGSTGFSNAGLTTYGDADIKRPVNGGMPAWGDSLTPDELMDVVLHERTTIDEEEFDIEKWKTNFEEDLSAHLPADKVEAFKAVLDKWEANPPA
ncbi:MAG: cytochrome c [Microthrixaceae bacterium]